VGLNLRLSVQRMDLLPSIARPSTLASNTPLAASFHNWLAERRYALTLLKDLDWPQYMMTLNVEPLVEFHNQSNCLNELLSLPTLVKSKQKTASTSFITYRLMLGSRLYCLPKTPILSLAIACLYCRALTTKP